MKIIFTFGSSTADLNAFERKLEIKNREEYIGIDNRFFEFKK